MAPLKTRPGAPKGLSLPGASPTTPAVGGPSSLAGRQMSDANGVLAPEGERPAGTKWDSSSQMSPSQASRGPRADLRTKRSHVANSDGTGQEHSPFFRPADRENAANPSQASSRFEGAPDYFGMSGPATSMSNSTAEHHTLAPPTPGGANNSSHAWTSFLSPHVPQTPGGVTPLVVPPTPSLHNLPGQQEQASSLDRSTSIVQPSSSSYGVADGGTTPTLRFPSATSLNSPVSTSFNAQSLRGEPRTGKLSGGSASSVRTTASAAPSVSPSDLARFTAIEAATLVGLLQGDINGDEQGSSQRSPSTASKPYLRRASRSSSPGAASSSSAIDHEDVATSASTLVLDIRPSTSFNAARIAHSVNVCAPSTLLKRPAMTVDRIEAEMLGSSQDARRFKRWRKGLRRSSPQAVNSGSVSDDDVEDPDRPIRRIVVVDTDTRSLGEAGRPNTGGGGACLTGLLRKFDAAGFQGDLCWLIGGFNGFASTVEQSKDEDHRGLLEHRPLRSEASSSAKHAPPRPESLGAPDTERTRRSSMPRLPSDGANASQVSEHGGEQRHSLVQPRGLPAEAFTTRSLAGSWNNDAGQRRMRGVDLSQSQPSNLSIGQTQPQSQASANPFFDNIRQNRELAHGVTETVPLDIPKLDAAQREILPTFLQSLVDMDSKSREQKLAEDFFHIERDEQQRLMQTMRKHAAQSSLDPRLSGDSRDIADPSRHSTQEEAPESAFAQRLASKHSAVSGATPNEFPFSIAAALERGAENRYNNIWTYEHSRVRVNEPPAGCTDYLNASFVEPLKRFAGKRRYIATQAPLPSTFETFWLALWEQNVHTIAMLTREHEAGRVQSHMYWGNQKHGSQLEVRSLSEEALDEKGTSVGTPGSATDCQNADDKAGGNMFPSMGASQRDGEKVHIIRRLLEVHHHGRGEKRIVTHLQYVAWPDYHIPDSPDGLLVFMDLAAAAQSTQQDVGPLLVHCSAGVGRTGTYIVIDSVLDVLRRKRAEMSGKAAPAIWENRVAAPSDATHTASSSSTRRMDGQPASQEGDYFSSRREPRKSLKRELSPSAMDVDSTAESVSSSAERRDIASPPPMRRSRSDADSVESDTLSLSGLSTSAGPSSSSSSSTGSATGGAFLAMTPDASRRASEVQSGMDTPSRAMRSLNIAVDPSASPSPGPVAQVGTMAQRMSPSPAVFNGPGQNTDPFAPQKAARSVADSGSTSPKSSMLRVQSSASQHSIATTRSSASDATIGDEDLVQSAVGVMREQRMSSVQTTRQFVFTYSAVLAGLLRELEAETAP